MNKSSNNWRVFLKSVWFGIIAGMISGMVKIGWEKILPPRTLARDVVNPPQHMLQQMGASYKFTHTYVIYNTDQKVFWVALILHFSFSIFFAWLLIYMVQFKKTAWAGLWEGALYGIIIWVAWHFSVQLQHLGKCHLQNTFLSSSATLYGAGQLLQLGTT